MNLVFRLPRAGNPVFSLRTNNRSKKIMQGEKLQINWQGRITETEIVHPSAHSPDDCNSWGWPGHPQGWQRSVQAREPSSTAFRGTLEGSRMQITAATGAGAQILNNTLSSRLPLLGHLFRSFSTQCGNLHFLLLLAFLRAFLSKIGQHSYHS